MPTSSIRKAPTRSSVRHSDAWSLRITRELPDEACTVRVPRAGVALRRHRRCSRSTATRPRSLAGGQSLVPMLALRLTRFEHIVDLNRVDDLRGVSRANGTLTMKAMTTPARRSSSDAAAGEAVPLLAEAIPLIGHFQIRNRGTVGGSIAHADPASELPAVALALDAELEVAGHERHPPRAGVGVLRRHVDHHGRRGRDPHRGALPRVVGQHRLRGRRGRAPQRRLRAHRRRRGGRGRRQRRGVARAVSRSSAWRPRPVRARQAEQALGRHVAERVRPRGDRPRSRSPTPSPPPTSTRRPSTASTSAPTSWCAPSTEPWEPRVAEHAIQFTVNGQSHSGSSEARKTLADYLREDCGLTGTHLGCEHGVCGACTILARRRGGALVPDVRGAGRRRRHHHHRGHRSRRRLARPGAGGVPPGPRPPVRVLHARLRGDRARVPRRTTRTPASTRSRRGCRATSAAAPATRGSSRRCRSPRRR